MNALSGLLNALRLVIRNVLLTLNCFYNSMGIAM
jgi:hypothetical protein